MKRSNRRLKPALARLRALADSGALERNVAKDYARALQRLERACDSRDLGSVRRAIVEISRLFVR